MQRNQFPKQIFPMLATLVKKPFNDKNWIFEIKWDGFRALAFLHKGNLKLKSRTEHLLNEKFPTIVKALLGFKHDLILDGELVMLDELGKSHFQLMQLGEGALCYYLFDLLYFDGHDLRDEPLIERKMLLKKLIKELDHPQICYSEHIEEQGVAFFKEAVQLKLEGIIGKKRSSAYVERRSRDWVKIKSIMRQEFVIGGFTAPRGGRKKFGALLIGVYQGKDLIYSGHVGGGFNEELLYQVYEKLAPLVQLKCPFNTPPKPNTPVTWVKPKLVCEVAFSEWTHDNILRQPVFQGLRIDKKPKDVVKEVAK